MERCSACLSVGRTLHPLGSELTLYQTLLAGNTKSSPTRDGVAVFAGESDRCRALVCWECRAVLRAVGRFMRRARAADQYLRSAQANMEAKSLSMLGTSYQQGVHLELVHTEDSHSPPAPASLASDDDNSGAQHLQHAPKMAKRRKPCKREAGAAGKRSHVLARVKTVRMSEQEMRAAREDDRRRPFYVKARFRCETCLFGYYRETQYRDHVEEKHSEKAGAHICPICQCRFHKLPLLESHTRRHYRLLRCRACGQQHRDTKRMLRHLETQHEDNSFVCADCDLVFPRYYALRYHRESCHRESTQCPHCGKVLSSRTNYRRHLLLHTGMPTRECDVCHKTFRGDALFQSHQRVHRAAPAPDAYCAECDLHFKHTYIYRQHVKYSRRHITPDLLKFPCTACERKFRQRGHLQRHFDAVHLKKTKFVCPHCDKNICSASALRTHVRRVHERVPPAKDKVCDICARTFATKATLQNHIRTHTGERPFRCGSCGATFGHSSALWTHNKLVHLKLKRGQKKAEDMQEAVTT